ncbi:MAG: hypothetical protein WCT05_09945, partial [Lentisphaeria bacterium]
GSGEDPELEAPATFWERGGSGAGSSGYILGAGRIRSWKLRPHSGSGEDPELEAPATFWSGSGDMERRRPRRHPLIAVRFHLEKWMHISRSVGGRLRPPKA